VGPSDKLPGRQRGHSAGHGFPKRSFLFDSSNISSGVPDTKKFRFSDETGITHWDDTTRRRSVRMSLNGLFAVRKPPGMSSAHVLNLIQPLLRSSVHFKDHLVSRDAPGPRGKRRKFAEKKVKVLPPRF